MRNLFPLFAFLFCGLWLHAQVGQPVASFGNNGKVFTYFPDNFQPNGRSSIGKAVIPLQDGKTLVAVESAAGMVLIKHLANGQKDPTFGFNGFSQASTLSSLHGAKMQPNGYIIVYGNGSEFNSGSKMSVARFRPDGFLDPTFGTNGVFKLDYGIPSSENELVLLADNRIMLAGTAVVNGAENFYLVRLAPNGKMDPKFGTGGMVTYDNSLFKFQLRDMAVQSDGRIIVGGNATAPDPTPLFQLARFLPDGTPDRSFGSEGTVATKISDSHNLKAIALQADGKIVLLGGLQFDGGEMLLARYHSNGALDSSFSHDGKQIVTNNVITGRRYLPEDIIILPDGKIMIGGAFAEHATIWRLHANGELDPSFYGTGYLQYDQMHTRVFEMAVYPNGKIGFAGFQEGTGNFGFANHFYLFARLEANGAADFSLAGTSFLLAQYQVGGAAEYSAVATLPDGKILAAGTAWSRRNGAPSMIVSRYHPDGSLDKTFGNGGIVNREQGLTNVKLMLVYPDGRILLYGDSFNRNFIRLLPNGDLDPSFSIQHSEILPKQIVLLQNGTVAVVGTRSGGPDRELVFQKLSLSDGSPIPEPGIVINTEQDIEVKGAVVLASGKILIGGEAWRPDGNDDFSVTRLNSDGSPDLAFGKGGTQLFDFGGSDHPGFMKLMPNGGAFLAGQIENSGSNNRDLAMVQFNSDGSLNTAFGNNGKRIYDLDAGFPNNGQNFYTVTTVDVQNNGKILLSGVFNDGNANQYAVGRINEDGKLDPTFGTNGYYVENLGFPLYVNASALAGNRLYLVGSAGTSMREHSLLAAYHIDDQPLQSTNRQALAPGAIEGTVQVLNNPAITEFTLNLDLKKPGGIQLRILDASGGVIEHRQNIAARGAQRFGANYRPGTYLAEITQGAQKTTIKLIKL